MLPENYMKQTKKEIIKNLQQLEEYKESSLLEKMIVQKKRKPFGDKVLVVFSDIDDTLRYIPSLRDIAVESANAEGVDAALKQQLAFYQVTLDKLNNALREHAIPLIAVTGRSIEEVIRGQAGGDRYPIDHLPEFDVIVASIGSEIYVRQKNGTYAQDSAFAAEVQNTGFNRKIIYPEFESLLETFATDLPEARVAFQARDAKENGVTTSPPPERYKISFNCEGSEATIEQVVHRFHERLQRLGLPTIKVVVSSDKQVTVDRRQYNIDIVPFTKKETVNYLVKRYGCWGIFGGDSGNDADAVMGAGNAGFVVGNRKDELARRVNELGPGEFAIRKEKHFTIVEIEEDGARNVRLLFIDPQKERKGPASVYAAFKAFSRLFMRNKGVL